MLHWEIEKHLVVFAFCSNTHRPLDSFSLPVFKIQLIIFVEKIPQISQHVCESTENYDDMNCTFYTNSERRDHMHWTIAYTLR